MLKEFTIKNFKSINDEITLSMEADVDRVSEHPEHIKRCNEANLLRVASMYGPNGGGKSNIIEAIDIFRIVALGGNQVPGEKKLACSFSGSDVIELTGFFLTGSYEIGYKLGIKANVIENQPMQLFGQKIQNSFTSFEIVSEDLVYRKKYSEDFITLFERDAESKIEGDIIKRLNNSITVFSKTKSMLSKMYEEYANNDSKDLPIEFVIVRTLYRQLLNVKFLDFSYIVDNQIMSFIQNNKQKIIKSLNDLDIKVDDIIFSDSQINSILFARKAIVNGKKKNYYVSLVDESNGTKKIFWIILNILNALNTDSIYLCDDMNAYLHPKIYKEIIKLFNNSADNKAQLIFNSHDILNMNNENFRRDEIMFVYENEDYSTEIVSLSNIVNYKGEQIRKDAKYYKQYLEGKYGADPFIEKGLNWNE